LLGEINKHGKLKRETPPNLASEGFLFILQTIHPIIHHY